MKNADMPAMPLTLETYVNENVMTVVNDCFEGLTKREMLANDWDVSEQFKSIDSYIDMANLLGEEYNPSMREIDRIELEFRFIAKLKVMAADALLAELDKESE